MAQRTSIASIVWSCVRVQPYEAVRLQLMGVNITLPATLPRSQYMKALLSQVLMALAPLISIMRLANIIKAIIDMLQSALTLDIPKMTEAFQAIMQLIGDVLGMIPQTSVPKFIFDLLKLYGMIIDILIGEIRAIIDFEAMLVVNAYNADAIACARENLVTIKLQKMREVQGLLLILEPINVLLSLAGLDEISAPSATSFEVLITVLTSMREVIQGITGEW